MSFSLVLIYLPHPLPPPKKFFSELPIILSACQFKISARIRLHSVLIVGCLLKFFLDALSKVFLKASLSLMKEQFSRLAKSAPFRLISGYTGGRLIPGLTRKDWILRASLLAVTSLWPQKVGSRGENSIRRDGN